VEESTAAQCRHIFWMMEGKFEQTPQKKHLFFQLVLFFDEMTTGGHSRKIRIRADGLFFKNTLGTDLRTTRASYTI
jgi:hypothetical protein